MPTTNPETDARWMSHAIRLAMNGRGRVEPNPMVGCVLVKADRVIGEGYHQQFGGPHAEPNALAACTESPQGATAYVTLEPCCHTNKKTPPCVPALIAAQVSRVVIGALDPNPEVNGRGVELLRAAGIVVDVPVLGAEARQLIAPFVKQAYDPAVQRRRGVYVTLKWAESRDGRVAGANGLPARISNAAATRAVHALRGRCDAILVGVNTVITDDPLLTARGVESPRRLTRAVLDTRLRIPTWSRLVRTAREHPLIVFTSGRALRRDRRATALELEALGVAVQDASPEFIDDYTYPAEGLSLETVVWHLSMNGATHLLVEPGPALAASFFGSGLVDRVWAIRSPTKIADPTAPAAATVPADYVVTGVLDLDGDQLTEYLNPNSSVFSGACESADMVLSRR